MYGYDPDRMKSSSDQFNCIICSNICREPMECDCGVLICGECLKDWVKTCNMQNKQATCPQCREKVDSFSPIKGKIKLMYNGLQIKCENFRNCKKIVDMVALGDHEKKCFGNNLPFGGSPIQNFSWDPLLIGSKMQLSNNNTKIILSENDYQFRTALANISFNNGVHYWEIEADSMTENEIKVGVSQLKDFDKNTCFADFSYGYSFYGIGQLRHNSNTNGASYGRRWRNSGVIGVLLDMENGSIRYCFNGEDLGEVYKTNELKNGPIYPAVALLHEAGCTIKQNIKPPDCYQLKL